MTTFPNISVFFKRSFLVLIYFLTTLLVINIFLSTWGLEGNSRRYGFQKMLDHTAYQPFVYRILVPELADAGTKIGLKLFPDYLENKFLIDPPLKRFISVPPEDWNLRVAVAYHLTVLLMVGFLFMSLWLLRYLSRQVFDTHETLHDFMPLLFLLLLPLTFQQGGFFYDFAEHFFVVSLLILLFSKKLSMYYLFFIIAMFNKESSLLLALYFPIFTFKNIKHTHLVFHIFLHVIIGAGILFFLRYYFASNPGVPMEDHLMLNIYFWLDYKSFLLTNNVYLAFPAHPRLQNILVFPIVLFFVFYKWREKPNYIKWMICGMAGVLIPLIMKSGYKDELRVFSIMFPLFYLCALHTISRIYGIPIRQNLEQASRISIKR